MHKLAPVLYLIVSVVNLLPVIGVVSADRLTMLYGLPIDDPNLEILLRHRAVLFAVVGVLLAVAAFRASWRQAATVAGLFSMLSFVALVGLVGDANRALDRVATIDVVASVLLVVAALVGRGRASSP